jgi:hypothetical protein
MTSIPVGTVFAVSVLNDKNFLRGLFAAAEHVEFRTRGAEDKLEVLRNRFQSTAYWTKARRVERYEDAQWIMDRINEGLADGFYFGTNGHSQWGFFRETEE